MPFIPFFTQNRTQDEVSNLSIESGPLELVLTWDYQYSADGYRVYRQLDDGTWAAQPYAVSQTTSFTDVDLDINEDYTYRVTSYNLINEGVASDQVTGRPVSELPRTPVFVRVTPSKIAFWEFFLSHSDDRSNIGRLRASSKQVNIIHNRPGSATCSMPLDHELAYQVDRWRTCIRAVRDGVERWSGPVTKINEKGAEMRLELTAEGWFEEVHKRVIRLGQELPSYANSPLHNIIYGLLERANKQRAGQAGQNPDGTNGNPDRPVRPTHVVQGQAFVEAGHTIPNFNRSLQKDQVIGAEIQALSDVENGGDIWVDPVTRELDVYYPMRGYDRPDVIFGFRIAPFNVQNAERSTDGSQLVNRFTAIGKYGGGMAEDEVSMDFYDLMSESVGSLSDVGDQDVLLAFAGAEVAIRSGGLVIYSFIPFPYTDGSSVPLLFRDYDVGDIVRLSVDAGRFQLNRQPVRIYGATIDVDDNNIERISSLQTSPTA